MTTRRNIRWIAALALASFLLPAGVPVRADDSRPKDVKQYLKLYRKANKQADAERWDKVLKLAGKMAPLAPEGSLHLSFEAKAHAQLGDLDRSVAAWERIVELGWTDTDGLPVEDEYAPLAGHPPFEQLSRRAVALAEAWKKENRTLHSVLDPAAAPPFDSVDELIDSFESRLDALSARSMLIAWPLYSRQRRELLDGKLAALERYLDDHAGAVDAERAALESVRTAARYREYADRFDGDAALIVEKAERFLAGWPASDSSAEVELQRALATWKAFGVDDEEATRPHRAGAATELFRQLEERHGDTPEATKSRVWRLSIDFDDAGDEAAPGIAELVASIESAIAEDEELAQYAWTHAARPMFQINGRRAFDAVDLAGKRWTWEAMSGKVVLIDFWATWCGPCIDELPNMKEAYEKFHDRGFEIVGVSLDSIGQSEFEEECRRLEIDWPQIHDGEGWETEIARQFYISGIPTPVLLDREGRVAGVHAEVRGAKLVERVGQLLDGAAPETGSR